MTRVAVALLSLALLAAPVSAEAQQSGKVYCLGILSPAAAPDPSLAATPNLVPAALRELGVRRRWEPRHRAAVR
jgi:hypothetical protein